MLYISNFTLSFQINRENLFLFISAQNHFSYSTVLPSQLKQQSLWKCEIKISMRSKQSFIEQMRETSCHKELSESGISISLAREEAGFYPSSGLVSCALLLWTLEGFPKSNYYATTIIFIQPASLAAVGLMLSGSRSQSAQRKEIYLHIDSLEIPTRKVINAFAFDR